MRQYPKGVPVIPGNPEAPANTGVSHTHGDGRVCVELVDENLWWTRVYEDGTTNDDQSSYCKREHPQAVA
jgi:hypothetical protein